MPNKVFQLQSKVKSQINVDCIKVCPFNPKLFAFAYYQQTQTFLGGICIKYIDQVKDLSESFQILHLGPVLHICWLNQIKNQKYVLLGASRQQKIYVLQFDPILMKLEVKKQLKVAQKSFCLYIDGTIINNNQIHIIVSTNESEVFYIQLNENYQIIQQQQQTFSKHQYAVWCCRLNQFKYGSKCKQNYQFACGDEVNSIYLYQKKKLIGRNKSAHEQGICDIVFKNQWELYSGGFDGFVCHLDTRMFQKTISTFKLTGTIWRILPSVNQQELLICNSSNKRFQVINSQTGNEVWNSGQHHTSLAYAADWSNKSILTSSFYDQVVCLWSYQ